MDEDNRGWLGKIFKPDPAKMKAYEDYRAKKQTEHLLTIGGMAVSAPLLLAAIQSRKTNKEREKRMKALQRAALAESPVMSLDRSLDDMVREKELEELGKTSQEGQEEGGGLSFAFPFKAPFKAPFSALQKGLGLGQKGTSWTYPATALVTAAVLAAMGSKYAKKQRNEKRKQKLEQAITDSKNKLDKEQFEILASQRGIALDKTSDDDFDWLTALTQLWPLYVLGLTYGGYKAGEHFGKETSSRTKAYKELEKNIEDKIKRSDKPAQLYMSPEMQNLFGPGDRKKSRREELSAGTVDIG